MSRHTQPTFRTRPGPMTRVVAAGALVVGLVAAPRPTVAQDTSAPRDRGPVGGRFELRPFAGAYLPTGDQHDLLRDAFLVGAQASYLVIPQLAVIGTFAWSPTRDHATPGNRSVDLFQYDVGAEGRAAAWLRGAAWNFTPFAGIGVGGRTYHVRDGGVDSQSKFAGYGAIGGELGFGRFGVRVEGRDYLSGAAPGLGGDASGTRNDVTVAAGLTIRF